MHFSAASQSRESIGFGGKFKRGMSSLICVSCLNRYRRLRKELQLLERRERSDKEVRVTGKWRQCFPDFARSKLTL